MNSISSVLASTREIGEDRSGSRVPSLASIKRCDTWSHIGADALSLLAAQGLAFAAVGSQPWGFRRESIAGYSLLLVFLAVCTLHRLDRIKSAMVRRPEQELASVVKALSAMFALAYLGTFAFYFGPLFRYFDLVWFVSGLPFVLAGRFIVRAGFARLWAAGYGRRRVAMIGTTTGLREFQRHLAIQRFRGYEMLGLIAAGDSDSEASSDSEVRVLGRIDNWREIVERARARVLVVDLNEMADRNGLILDILRGCNRLGIEVELANELFRQYGGECEIDQCSGNIRLRTSPVWSAQLQRTCKFVIDRSIGLLGSLVTIAIAPVIWVLLKTDDGGPLFYRQQFVGPDGNERHYLKFRSMIQNADQVLQNDPQMRERFAEKHKLEVDPRVLRTGRFLRRFSIDEFPEFFSVLTGNLSFVGPRTISMAEKSRYGLSLATLLSVKPGLTGYWQTMGRQTTSYEERVLMDMYYLNHWSIWMDLIIIGKTFCKFFAQDGAY